MTGLQHPLVQDYFARVESAARGLPPSIREELISDLSAHVDSSLTRSSTDANVQAALKELGDPDDVVAAAYEGMTAVPPPVPPATGLLQPHQSRNTSPWGAVEIIAVAALILGTFLLPFIGPIFGVVMAWASPRWTRTSKVVTTILSVGPVTLLVVVGIARALITGASFIDDGGFLLLFAPPLYLGAFISGIYLVVRLSRHRKAKETSREG